MDENWEVFLHFRTPPTGDKWNSPGYWLTLIMMIYDDHGMLCKTCRVCGIAPWRCRLQQRSTKVRCCICQDGNHDRCSSRPLPKTEPHFRNIKKRRSLIVWHNFNFSLKFKLFAIPMISWCHCSESHQGQHLSTKGRMYSRLPKWFSKFRCATLGEIPSAMASLAYGFYGQARHCKPLRLLEIPR